MSTESTASSSNSKPGCSVSLPEPTATQTVALWQVHPRDNVLIALRTIAQGEVLPEPYQQVTALEEIPAGHKVAIADLAQGAEVRKYGFAIGATTAAVKAGSHIHSHNTATNLSGERPTTTVAVRRLSLVIQLIYPLNLWDTAVKTAKSAPATSFGSSIPWVVSIVRRPELRQRPTGG